MTDLEMLKELLDLWGLTYAVSTVLEGNLALVIQATNADAEYNTSLYFTPEGKFTDWMG